MALASALALHAAALSGHVSTVKLLLDNDAQVDATDVMKHTPLFRACEMGHRDVIQTLIKGELAQGLLLGLTGKIGTAHTRPECFHSHRVTCQKVQEECPEEHCNL